MISTGKNMQRISDLEKKYVAEVLENEFQLHTFSLDRYLFSWYFTDQNVKFAVRMN